jgi:hypothetical protein
MGVSGGTVSFCPGAQQIVASVRTQTPLNRLRTAQRGQVESNLFIILWV